MKELEKLGHVLVQVRPEKVSGFFRGVPYVAENRGVASVHAFAAFTWAQTILDRLRNDSDTLTCTRALGYRYENGIVSSAFSSATVGSGGKEAVLRAVANMEYRIADDLVREKYKMAHAYDRALTLIGDCLRQAAPNHDTLVESIAFYLTGVDCEISLKPRRHGKRRMFGITIETESVVESDSSAVTGEIIAALRKAGIQL